MKQNTIFFILINLLTAFNAIAQEHIQLTTEQKIADFDSLYHQLQYAFPDFEITKRVNHIDWLSNYEIYKSRITNTQNDKEYLAQLDTIIQDLHCGHADILPTKYYHYYHSAYKIASIIMGGYKPYIRELNKNGAKKKNKYWTEICKDLYPKSHIGSNLSDLDDSVNVTFETVEEESIAVIHIKSFLNEHINKDKKAILLFFGKISMYHNLIIDIQDNTGGDTRYWQQNIVPYLIDSSVSYSSYLAFRDTPAFYTFAGKRHSSTVDSVPLHNLPPELNHGDYRFLKSDNSIKPNKNSIHYTGHIYVITNHNVFSSTEAFANFCKSSGFATVAGERTGGHGVGSDPFLYTLPESGIVVRYTGIMGLNADGSSNEEMGTAPDIIIDADSPDLRLKKLISFIKHKG